MLTMTLTKKSCKPNFIRFCLWIEHSQLQPEGCIVFTSIHSHDKPALSKTHKFTHANYTDVINVQSNRTTHSSDIITLQRHSVCSRLKVTDSSFTHDAPVLLNYLPKQLRQPSAPPSLGTTTDSNPLFVLSSHRSKFNTFLIDQFSPP